jgi:alginate O-acetyltransferase complex protein AlgI
MLFNTTEFFVFLAIVLAVFYAAPKSFRRVILLVASYVFYLSWNYKFVVLLLGLTVVDFGAAIAI